MIRVLTIIFTAAARMCALPLVFDSPWDLRGELSGSLCQLVSSFQCQSLTGIAEDNMEVLLSCATFHSVLLQRQTYKCSGQRLIYNW